MNKAFTVKTSNIILKNWVESAADGDEVSWYALYRQFHPHMYDIALRICRDNEIAADAVQEAFVTTYLKLSQLRDPNRFESWLRQIVTRTCYRSLSSNRKHISLESLPMENEKFWDDELTKKAEKLATQHRLHALLSALPDILNSTLLLRYFSNCQTYEEISAILHIPVGTVRSRLSEAKKKLGEYWQRHETYNNSWYNESEEWNAFYSSSYGGMHEHDTCKNKFLNHIVGGRITFPDGKQVTGNSILENMVEEDRQVGSWLKPINVISSGSISVIESVHFNSTKHPQHCPAGSIIVLFRKAGKGCQLFIHPSKK